MTFLRFLALNCILSAALSGFSQTPLTGSGSLSGAQASPSASESNPAQQSTTASPAQATDSQAMNLIANSIAAMGGGRGAAVQDFTATGDITYYWAGKEEKGSATVRGRGVDQLRFDANLAGGTRSWAVHAGSGTLREIDGKTTEIPYHNAVALGSLIFPLARLQALSTDTKASISYDGVSNVEQQPFERLRAHKTLFDKDPDGSGNRLLDADLYFDPTTHLLLGIQDQTHPRKSMTVDVSHAIYFSDYRQVNGLTIPFTVSEYVGGQRVWSLQISDVKFNTGLSDTDFLIQ